MKIAIVNYFRGGNRQPEYCVELTPSQTNLIEKGDVAVITSESSEYALVKIVDVLDTSEVTWGNNTYAVTSGKVYKPGICRKKGYNDIRDYGERLVVKVKDEKTELRKKLDSLYEKKDRLHEIIKSEDYVTLIMMGETTEKLEQIKKEFKSVVEEIEKTKKQIEAIE